MSSDSSTQNTNTSSTTGQHHSSHDLGHKKGTSDMFSGMKEYKRDPTNAAGEQRRESLKEMSAAQPGTLSNMWNNTFRNADSK